MPINDAVPFSLNQSDKVRSLRLHAHHDLRLVDEPVSTAGGEDELLRITAVGICGSDLHWLEEGGIGDAELNSPLVLGHEFAGVIETGPEAGTHVAVDPAIPCGSCRYCLEGNPNLCTRMRFAGHAGFDGALRELMPWPRRLIHRLPKGLSDVDGAMLEPLGVAIHATELGKVREGDLVGIFGSGPIGLLILQVVRSAGGRVVLATDRKDHRLDVATRLGADHVVNVDNPTSAGEIALIADTHQLDVVFEASTSNDAVEDAIGAVRPGGRVVLVGIPSDNRTSFEAAVARRKGLTIKLVRRMRETYPRAIELATSGEVDLETIVSHQYDFDDHEAAFETAVQRSGLKVIIHPNAAH